MRESFEKNKKGILLMIVAAVLACVGQLLWKLSVTNGILYLLLGFGLYGLGALLMLIAYRYAGETADRTASVSLAAVSGALSRWEAGKSYRYRITIGPADFILFEAPTIEPWQESTGGSIRID